jgi:hypothetical protein
MPNPTPAANITERHLTDVSNDFHCQSQEAGGLIGARCAARKIDSGMLTLPFGDCKRIH